MECCREVTVFFKKKSQPVEPYDPQKEKPELHTNTCNRDKVAGFRSLEDGRFHEMITVRSDDDLKEFCRRYAVKEEDIRKVW